MNSSFNRVKLVISSIRLIPHLIILLLNKNREIIKYEIVHWLELTRTNQVNVYWGFVHLMTLYPEFRNLFYYRIGPFKHLISFLCPKMNTLFINTLNIGPGLFIQHGFATIIAANSIGRDCWVNQQVTIGFSNATDAPDIGDNVAIKAGAKVLGGITVGNNSTIGANAVVVKNVPDNCVVVGVPAYIIKRNGIKVKEDL
jgi:serine O-acetyltransferase